MQSMSIRARFGMRLARSRRKLQQRPLWSVHYCSAQFAQPTLVFSANQAEFRCWRAGLPSDYFYPGDKGVVPWPRPALGKWEMRDGYVIEMSRLPAYASGYCYGRRVIYVDKETLYPLTIDLYDLAGGLYKLWARPSDSASGARHGNGAGRQRRH
jgi:hypothetical protein